MLACTGETQNELTPICPRTPYSCAKAYAHFLVNNYRERYDLHASCGILCSHESKRRTPNFVTKKIAQAAARIKTGTQQNLSLGNLDSGRDWGAATDFVRAYHLILQQPKPGDYVIGTGETHTLRDILDIAFSYVGLDWTKYVTLDPKLFRPWQDKIVKADWSKLRAIGWAPTVTFEGLIQGMVNTSG